MSNDNLVLILTNSAMAGLAFVWIFINLAYYSRRKRPLHLAGALFSMIMTAVFLMRTLSESRVIVIGDTGLMQATRWLWFFGVLVWLIYSIVFLSERRGTEGKNGNGNA